MEDSRRERAEKATQAYAALGVGFICIILGVPIWWKTTEIYRVQLPYSSIAELGQKQVQYTVDLTMIVFDDEVQKSKLATLGENLRQALGGAQDQAKVRPRYQGNVRHAYPEEMETFTSSQSLQDFDAALEELKESPELGKYTIVLLPSTSKLSLSGKVHVGRRRASYLYLPKDLDSLLPLLSELIKDVYANENSMSDILLKAKGATHQKADKASMRSLRSHAGYDVTFTLLNPQPDILRVKWAIKDAANDFLSPFLTALKDYIDVTVKSQVIHYTGLVIKPHTDSKNSRKYLNPEELPHIITPIEGHLGSHVSNNPNLNFVVYIPTRDQSPLHIYTETGTPSPTNAFLSPRWGGLLIHNVATPPSGAPLPQQHQVDMKGVLGVFLAQLRLLLGVPTVAKPDMHFDPPNNTAITHWELDLWLRSRTLENIGTSTATLQSLAQLLEQISNIVINDEIGQEVENAVEAISQSQAMLAQGNLGGAFLASQRAIVQSEKAFFDPSLLELLYFPEDQKFAIYIPLFLPISIPVLMALVQAFKWMRASTKPKTQEKK